MINGIKKIISKWKTSWPKPEESQEEFIIPAEITNYVSLSDAEEKEDFSFSFSDNVEVETIAKNILEILEHENISSTIAALALDAMIPNQQNQAFTYPINFNNRLCALIDKPKNGSSSESTILLCLRRDHVSTYAEAAIGMAGNPIDIVYKEYKLLIGIQVSSKDGLCRLFSPFRELNDTLPQGVLGFNEAKKAILQTVIDLIGQDEFMQKLAQPSYKSSLDIKSLGAIRFCAQVVNAPFKLRTTKDFRQP